MKRVAICEDNKIEAEILEELLQAYFRRAGIKAEIFIYHSGETLVADVEEKFVDVELIFLDIYMDKLNGMETARKLRELHCNAEIVFLTATAKYAIESYDVNAVGYLLKPIDMTKILPLLDRIFGKDTKRRIEIKSGRQFRYPYIKEIVYIDSLGHYVMLHMADGSTIQTLQKISELQKILDDDRFLYCHQSYLVNMDYIADIQKEIHLWDGTCIPVSARRKKEVKDSYHIYFQNSLS